MGEIPSWVDGAGFDADMESEKVLRANDRFWLKQGSTRKIIFLTEDPVILFEHQVYIPGGGYHYATCLRPLDIPCALCDYADDNSGQAKRSRVAVFSIIDTTTYVDKAEKEHSNIKKLLMAKKGTFELLKRRQLKIREAGHPGLQYALVEAYRTNKDKSPAVGDEFEYIKHVDPTTLEDTEEFDWQTLLAPDQDKTRNVLRKLTGGSSAPREDFPDSWSDKPSDAPSEGTDTSVKY